ncbi:MAG: Flp pilus assembly protein CpaB [Acidobacteria bacterium]|nr:Flp pilus assembly protein CpaB [Acidobacteriota bacterium]MCI0718506.1 Flp pilus assembly protein CpaB [Acidobacteriota bacterium]
MNRARILIVLMVAVVVGGALSYAVYNFLQSRPVTVVRTPEKNVVVAVGALPLGTLLKDENLKFVSWPATNLPPGYFERKEDLLSRGLVQPVVVNEPILESKLAPKGSGAGLPPVIPKGMRALSIRANEIIGVAGYVGVGTRVDVVLTATLTGAQEAMTKIVLQNVEVASAGQVIQKDPEGKPQTVTVVTLFVTPEDAEKLTTASSQGQFQLALRNPLDLDEAKTKGSQLSQLIRGAPAAPAPVVRAPRRVPQVIAAPPPVAPATNIEVIKGEQRSTVKF